MSDSTDTPYLLAFTRFHKFGAVHLGRIRDHFPSFAEAWRASRDDFLRAGVHPNLAAEFVAVRPTISPNAEMERVAEHGLELVPFGDERYPSLLSEIHDPPAVLFVRGVLPARHETLLSIVGSRDMGPYGARVLEELIPELIRAGIGIVSGLAIGVDGHAHHLCVEAGGRTWGILAGGCDWKSLSPSRHRHLAGRMIAGGGGIMSEFPIGTPSLKNHFPVRNRIISGMTRATLVIEATEKSGSLITAKSALDQNREVMAVPGPITSPLSLGPNRLIRQGAHAVTCAKDILEVLNVEPQENAAPRQPLEPQNATEAALLSHLTHEPKHVDDLARESSLPTSLVLSTLTTLELRDGVQHTGGNRYRLSF